MIIEEYERYEPFIKYGSKRILHTKLEKVEDDGHIGKAKKQRFIKYGNSFGIIKGVYSSYLAHLIEDYKCELNSWGYYYHIKFYGLDFNTLTYSWQEDLIKECYTYRYPSRVRLKTKYKVLFNKESWLDSPWSWFIKY